MGYTYIKSTNQIIVCPHTGIRLKNYVTADDSFKWTKGTIKVFKSNGCYDFHIFISTDHNEYPFIFKPTEEHRYGLFKQIFKFNTDGNFGNSIILGIKKDQLGSIEIKD